MDIIKGEYLEESHLKKDFHVPYIQWYAFQLWCWGRLLRVPQTARKSNQSILKEIKPEYSLEGLMLKLKLQYFGHLIYWFWERLRAEGRRRRRPQKMRWLNSLTNSTDMNLSKLREMVKDGEGSLACCSPWSLKESDMTEWLNNNNPKTTWAASGGGTGQSKTRELFPIEGKWMLCKQNLWLSVTHSRCSIYFSY